MNAVKVYSDNGKTKVEINGQPVAVRAITFMQTAETVPEFGLDLSGYPDVEIEGADIRVSFTPTTIWDAVKVPRKSLKRDPVMRKSWETSIWSVLEESEQPGYGEVTNEILAERILSRLVGDEEW